MKRGPWLAARSSILHRPWWYRWRRARLKHELLRRLAICLPSRRSGPREARRSPSQSTTDRRQEPVDESERGAGKTGSSCARTPTTGASPGRVQGARDHPVRPGLNLAQFPRRHFRQDGDRPPGRRPGGADHGPRSGRVHRRVEHPDRAPDPGSRPDARGRQAPEVTPDTLRRVVQSDSELSEILLRAFILRRVALLANDRGDAVLIGSSHSAATLRIREFLTRDGQPHIYLEVEEDPGVQFRQARWQMTIPGPGCSTPANAAKGTRRRASL